MSNKFVVNGGLSIPSGKLLEIGSLSLSGIYQGDILSDDEANKKIIPSEYSVKKYVDAQLSSTDMIFAASSNSGELTGDDLKVDLSGGETFSIVGTTNEIETDTAVANQIKVGLPSAVTITTSAAIGGLSISAGSITDDTGEIDFSNENLSTTGTLAAGATTVTGAMSATGAVTAGSIVVGAADMSEADLEKLDGITDGTAAANKALVVDVNKDIGTIRNITIDGTFSDGNYTFDTDGNVAGLGTIDSGAITSTGAVQGSSLTDGTMTVTSGNMSAVGTIDSGAITSTGASSMATLTVSTSANLANGSTMASAAAPTEDAGIANKKYVDDQVTGADLDVVVGGTNYDLDLTTEKLAFAGTANEITVAFVESDPDQIGNEGTLTVSLPDDVTIGNALTVTGASNMNGAVTLGNATADDITFTGRAASGIAPKTDDMYDLGTSALHWDVTYSNEVRGDANEMIISADGDETSVSGETASTLSLNASGGIFTDDAVDMDSTLNVESTVTMQADATVGTTLAVTGVGTFTAQSVHTGGLESGGDIVSDNDSTDSLGSSAVRWLNVHTDEVAMENSSKKDFSVAMTGSAVEVANLAGFESGKIVLKVKNGTDITTKEILCVNGAFVEYATISSGTEVEMTIAVSGDSVTVNSASGTAKGSVDLIK